MDSAAALTTAEYASVGQMASRNQTQSKVKKISESNAALHTNKKTVDWKTRFSKLSMDYTFDADKSG